MTSLLIPGQSLNDITIERWEEWVRDEMGESIDDAYLGGYFCALIDKEDSSNGWGGTSQLHAQAFEMGYHDGLSTQ